MSQKLHVDGFKWVKNTCQINRVHKDYNEDSNEGYIFEIDVEYFERLHEFHSNSPFSTKRMKIGKVEKLVAKGHDAWRFVVHKRKLKQALNHGLILETVHRIIKFNQTIHWYDTKNHFEKKNSS